MVKRFRSLTGREIFKIRKGSEKESKRKVLDFLMNRTNESKKNALIKLRDTQGYLFEAGKNEEGRELQKRIDQLKREIKDESNN